MPQNIPSNSLEFQPNTILLVDDDPDTRSLARTFLEHENYQVLSTGDADRAAKIFHTAPKIDLLIADLDISHRSGMNLARKLKAFRQDLPVLITSGGLVPEGLRKQLKLQGWNFLPRHFALPQLLSSVHVILNSVHPTLTALSTMLRR